MLVMRNSKPERLLLQSDKIERCHKENFHQEYQYQKTKDDTHFITKSLVKVFPDLEEKDEEMYYLPLSIPLILLATPSLRRCVW